MNAILLEPEVLTWLSSLSPNTIVPKHGESAGWKSELERLSFYAKRRERKSQQ
jgi:hypothetical protein